MNKKNRKKLLLLTVILTVVAAIIVTCDMTHINNDDSATNGRSANGELTERERDELEKNGHFLKLTYMPLNTQIPNVFSVNVANSATNIAKLDEKEIVCIYRDEKSDFSTVYLMLAYNDASEFIETGYFYSAFTVHVDALTKYIVEITDKLLVYYTDGRGQIDVRELPGKSLISADPTYLTIFNLPANVSIQNIAKVMVQDQTGTISSCKDYSSIEISVNDNLAVAKIPLEYHNSNSIFAETGSYYVLFDINVDIDTRYLVTKEDHVKIPFIKGNGFLDIQNIPIQTIPYLTIQKLPYYTTKKQITNVNVYNLAGTVATCQNYNDIIIFKENGYTTVRIPLSCSGDNDWFQDTGRFIISFTVNVDAVTQFSLRKEDKVTLDFVEGSALYDILYTFGYFNAELTNLLDTTVPIIKAGSSFDIDGIRHLVPSNLTVQALTPSSTCLLYLYASWAGSEVYYEFSTTTPTWHDAKKGFYNDRSRALWKMVYIPSENKFLFKTYIANDFRHFEYASISDAVFNSFTQSRQVLYSLSGSSNPNIEDVTLMPGVYVAKLVGAGGGNGGGYYNSTGTSGIVNGGTGGLINDIFTVNHEVTINAFTGSGGSAAPPASGGGTISITGGINRITFSGYSDSSYGTVSYPTNVSNVTIASTSSRSGGGGGGGGSGTFLYSDQGYFLCAGGGGGGSGGACVTSGGGGGGGGSIGPGGGGGSRGTFTSSSVSNPGSGNGGRGGGVGGGSGGIDTSTDTNRNGISGSARILLTFYPSSSLGGNGASGTSSSLGNPSVGTRTVVYRMGAQGNEWESSFSTPVVTLHSSTNSYTTTSGGNGGDAAVYVDGSFPWVNTNGVNGAGGSAPRASSMSASGTVTGNTITTDGADQRTNQTSYLNKFRNVSTGSINVSSPSPGNSGSPGGNNRNSNKGGGSTNGSPGSITIYKIY